MAGILAATLSSVIVMCDEKSIDLSKVISKPWSSHFMDCYDKLFIAEEADETD